MDMLRRSFLAVLTDPGRPLHSCVPRRSPADAVGSRRGTLPPGMGRSDAELGLPFCHASISAEHPFAVEVAGRSGYVFAAPLARVGFKIASAWVGSPGLPRHAARERTEPLSALARAIGRRAARLTHRCGRGTPTVLQIAGRRTEPLGLAIAGKRPAAPNTMAFHLPIIACLREIEERYCEIAARRLDQMVLPMELA